MQKSIFNIICEDCGEERCIYVNDINSIIEQGKAGEMIKVAEAYQERRFSSIADTIFQQYKDNGVRIIMLSGPSSSGKTTSSKRLSLFFEILGLDPVLISLDDYFQNREFTPIDEYGQYDFEALGALDIPLFNTQLLELIDGKQIQRPTFDFVTGTRIYNPDKKLKLAENSILIVEGIHALNPKLTSEIDDKLKFNIFVSPETSIKLNEENTVEPAVSRLIRRIVRDNSYRNSPVQKTLERWPSVRRGEQRHIFPFKDSANITINTSISFELNVLKRAVMPIISKVDRSDPQYDTIRELIRFLDFFSEMDDQMIPPTSILREFIGGSSFEYV